MAGMNLQETFDALKRVLKRHRKGLVLQEGLLGSQAKEKKPALHLYGKHEVSIAGRKPQQTYVAGIIQQRDYVGFYHMPIYSHPQEFKLSAALAKARKGKSCLHIRDVTPEIVSELEELLAHGIKLYGEQGWL